MRVAALYDIHGNLPALEAVLDDVRLAGVVGGDVLSAQQMLQRFSAVELENPRLNRLYRSLRALFSESGVQRLVSNPQRTQHCSTAPDGEWLPDKFPSGCSLEALLPPAAARRRG